MSQPVQPGASPPHGPSGRIRASPIEWALLVVGLALIVRYRWLFDDAFVYFRYVDNLLFLDAGLTFNRGEYVEGFTSPAHCLLLACLRSLRLGYPAITLGVGLAAWTAFWWLAVRVNRLLSGEAPHRSCHGANLPLAAVATQYTALSFYTAGHESALLFVAAGLHAWFFLRPDSRSIAALVGATPLVRPELALAVVVAALWSMTARRRVPWVLIASTLVLNGAWLTFRIAYYADLWPNVYHLKVGATLESESNLTAGLRYLTDAVRTQAPVWATLAIAVLFAVARSGRDLRQARYGMWVTALVVGAWTVWSGGSSMRFYYLAFPLTLLALSAGGAVERLASIRVARGVTLAVAALALCLYPANLTRHPITGHEEMREPPSPTVLTDPSYFRRRPQLDDPWPTLAELRELAPRLARDGYAEVTDVGWCNAIYAHPEARSVHPYGLTDAILARVRTPEVKRGHKPGLAPLAHDLIRAQVDADVVGLGVYTNAIENGTAPQWMSANARSIELLERKMYGPRGLFENLELARCRIEPIQP